MGIFSKNSNNTKKNLTTKDFYFGAPEAEGENVDGYRLVDYFEDFLDILDSLEKGKFIFVGRKGVGKSAIAKYIKDTSDNSDDSSANILRISDLNAEKLIQSCTDIDDVESLIFEWLILVNIIKLVIKEERGKYTKEYSKLKTFLERNTGTVGVDKFQVDEILQKREGQVNFEVLTHVFGGVFKKYFDVKTKKAPFYKLISPLKEVLKILLDYDVNKDFEFWLLFDDLDINYNIDNKKDNKSVLELLRIAKIYNNEIFKNNKAKILVFIRDDVRNHIITRYADSAKIFNSYEIGINWYNNNEFDNPLKKLANKRIEKTFLRHNLNLEEDAWDSLFKRSDYGKSTFKQILDYTFYRPRDIVTFLSIVSKKDLSFPLSSSDIAICLNDYIKANVTEIQSELSLYFNAEEKDVLFNKLFHYVAYTNNAKYEDVLYKIEEFFVEKDSEGIFRILYNYSLLILKSQTGELYFNYRDNTIKGNIDEYIIVLPKCLYHYYKPL
jgi:hypothetical protein